MADIKEPAVIFSDKGWKTFTELILTLSKVDNPEEQIINSLVEQYKPKKKYAKKVKEKTNANQPESVTTV